MAEERQESDTDIQDFILSRELAEVYLLLDHLSACQCKEIPASLNNDPVFKNSEERTWLEQICEIAWPPEESDSAKDARNAAKLIRAKDVLNKAAAPATGGSIAFTLMVAGEARDPQSGSWWRRVLLWMADGISNRDGGGSPPADGGGGGLGWPGGKPPSRASLAALAYPSLSRRAWRYRFGLYLVLVLLVFWLGMTCILSWEVATGSSLLSRVTTLESRIATLQSAAAETKAGNPTQNAPPAAGGDSAARQDAGNQTATENPLGGASAPQTPSQDILRLMDSRNTALQNLAHWMNDRSFVRRILLDRIGGSTAPTIAERPTSSSRETATGTEAASASPPTTNAEWAAVLLGILASNILPIFYGLLGAGAAVVRMVAQKMRDSVLAPRDILLAYVQLALGAVIGACIGLFVDSDGQAATTAGGLLASVPLSASALCFIAGFGVEGVFQALESLIRRVFNLDGPRPAPTA